MGSGMNDHVQVRVNNLLFYPGRIWSKPARHLK